MRDLNRILRLAMWTMRSRPVLFALIIAFSAGCFAASRFPATGTVAGQSLSTTVDSELARFYVEHHLRGDGSDSAHAQVIDSSLREVKPDPYDRETLKQLSQRLSIDFAAIYFASALYERPNNKRAQDAFHAILRTLTDPAGDPTPPKGHSSYLMAFVPGYAYKKDPTTGADFARQRAILRQRGFRTTLIETDELGTVEKNADIVADSVRQFAGQGQKAILVSTSKGGPEVALALGDRLSLEDSAYVKAWISVGGLLRGSPYADHALRWPRRWFAEIILRIQGYRPSIIRNLSTTVRRPVFDHLRLPRHILTVQYVGVPLSGQIGESVRGRYETLRPLGPNDGLTLLVDELVPGGVVVTDIGLDHYYRDPIIELKTIALAYLVLGEVEQREKGPRGTETYESRPNKGLNLTGSLRSPAGYPERSEHCALPAPIA